MLNTVFWLQFEKKNLGNQRKTRDILSHGLRTPRETFFQKNQNFWAWADKLRCTYDLSIGSTETTHKTN